MFICALKDRRDGGVNILSFETENGKLELAVFVVF